MKVVRQTTNSSCFIFKIRGPGSETRAERNPSRTQNNDIYAYSRILSGQPIVKNRIVNKISGDINCIDFSNLTFTVVAGKRIMISDKRKEKKTPTKQAQMQFWSLSDR